MNAHTTLAALSMAVVALSATAGPVQFSNMLDMSHIKGPASTVSTFDLFNHPDGLVSPSAYGLRLDSFSNGHLTTFSFENDSGKSQVQLDVIDTGTGLKINIHGLVHGNSADGGTNFGTFMLDVTYSVQSTALGYTDMNAESGQFVGGLTAMSTTGSSPMADGEFMDLFAMSDGIDTFRFLADGFRLDGDSSTWVGRGWVGPEGAMGEVNDFLFTAVAAVPVPPAAFAGMGMLVGLGAYRRLRRRG